MVVVGASVVVGSVVVVVVVGVVVSADVVKRSAPFLPLISLATCVSVGGDTVDAEPWGVTSPRTSGAGPSGTPGSGTSFAPVNSKFGGPARGGRFASNG